MVDFTVIFAKNDFIGFMSAYCYALEYSINVENIKFCDDFPFIDNKILNLSNSIILINLEIPEKYQKFLDRDNIEIYSNQNIETKKSKIKNLHSLLENSSNQIVKTLKVLLIDFYKNYKFSQSLHYIFCTYLVFRNTPDKLLSLLLNGKSLKQVFEIGKKQCDNMVNCVSLREKEFLMYTSDNIDEYLILYILYNKPEKYGIMLIKDENELQLYTKSEFVVKLLKDFKYCKYDFNKLIFELDDNFLKFLTKF